MIEVNSKYTKIEGHPVELLSELAGAIRGVYKGIKEKKGEEFAKEQINFAVSLALKPSEDLKKDVVGLLEEILTDVLNVIKEGKDEPEN